jgi:Cu(I)/Ag(I) efflux system membrane fusion protein
LLLVAGAVAGIGMVGLWPGILPGKGDTAGDVAGAEREPIYWVAPMDPSYRRDGPGKSPMGMDLVPVYADDASDDPAGTISISPQVVNNFGVRSAEVRRAPLGSEIRTVGYVRYDEERLVHIHPRLEGWVERLFVTASGDPVTKDQPLYELYSPQLVAAQEELVLALRRDNAVLVQAAEDRLRALQVAPELVESLKRDRRVRQTVTFSAPQDGVVDNLNIREGFYVGPATTLMSIGALDEVWVEAEVFERQADQVAVGQDVSMTLDFLPGRRWSGRVDYVYPSLDETTRTLRVRLRFPNPQRELRPNMFAQVVIVTDQGEPALLVPRESVIRLGDRNRVVLDLGGGRYRSVPVRLGRLGSRHYEVLTGLRAGDRVVTSAQFLIDSESSRQAELQRLGDPPEKPLQTARVQGTVADLAADRRLVTIDRDAIPGWRRPAATVTFIVDAAVDLGELPIGERIDFTFVIEAGEFVLTRVHADEDAGQEQDITEGGP